MKKQAAKPKSLPKVATGFPGFDAMTGGGLPEGRISVISGGAGTGKTLFAIQTLVNAIKSQDRVAVFVSFEESPTGIARNFEGFNWGLKSLIGKKLIIIDARWSSDTIQSGGFDLSGLLAGVESLVRTRAASLLALDGIDALLAMLPKDSDSRRELIRIHAWAEKLALTTIITTKTRGATGQRGEGGGRLEDIAMYMADCVVLLERSATDMISSRSLFVQKYRGSDHVQNKVPYVIGPGGIEVEPANPAPGGFKVFKERVPTGIEDLDDMLKGGYYRGSTTLISGSPGTSKTTLAAKFAETSCRRGERGLYICFDEAPDEIVRNVASVGIDLQPFRRNKTLFMEGFVAHSSSADELTSKVLALLTKLKPKFLVLDPVSAFATAGGDALGQNAVRLIVHNCKQAGITIILTSLIDQHADRDEVSKAHVSTLADNWLHVSYVINGGERNRALTIVKSRGTGHSNQVREMLLSDDGIHLESVYTEEGEVLMGALRWQREERARKERRQERTLIEHRQNQVEMEREELALRIAHLQLELAEKQRSLEAMTEQAALSEQSEAERRKLLAGIRSATSPKTAKRKRSRS